MTEIPVKAFAQPSELMPWSRADRDFFVGNPSTEWYIRDPFPGELENMQNTSLLIGKVYNGLTDLDIVRAVQAKCADRTIRIVVFKISDIKRKRIPIASRKGSTSPLFCDPSWETKTADEMLTLFKEQLADSEPVQGNDDCSNCRTPFQTGDLSWSVISNVGILNYCEKCVKHLQFGDYVINAIGVYISGTDKKADGSLPKHFSKRVDVAIKRARAIQDQRQPILRKNTKLN
jgi:hypothetical protein